MDGKKWAEFTERLKPYVLHTGECMIQWIEDGCDGQRALLVFNEEQHPFAELCKTDDNRQRRVVVHAIFVELDDEGNPINQEREHQLRNAEQKGGKYCSAFHMLYADLDFQRYAYKVMGMHELTSMDPSERAKAVEERLRRDVLKGQSSRMLDHDDQLQAAFRSGYLRPFNEWREARGREK